MKGNDSEYESINDQWLIDLRDNIEEKPITKKEKKMGFFKKLREELDGIHRKIERKIENLKSENTNIRNQLAIQLEKFEYFVKLLSSKHDLVINLVDKEHMVIDTRGISIKDKEGQTRWVHKNDAIKWLRENNYEYMGSFDGAGDLWVKKTIKEKSK